MALDAEEVATRARERITEQSETDAGFTVARLLTMVDDARRGLVELLAIENEGQFVYTKTFAVDAEDGVADLAAILAADEALIDDPNAFLQAKIYIDGYSQQLRIFPDRSGLTIDPKKAPACALEDENLYLKDSAGKLGTYGAEVRISGPYIPSLAHIRSAHKSKLIDVLVSVALATLKQTKKPAPRPATQGATS